MFSFNPGPITIRAVTGTLTEATSPSLKALATMAQNKTVVPIAIIPKSNKNTVPRATPAPITVPIICPKPSRTDLYKEIRILKLQIMAATKPPLTTKRSPRNQAKAEAIDATRICLIQIFLLVIILTILFSFNFIFLLY